MELPIEGTQIETENRMLRTATIQMETELLRKILALLLLFSAGVSFIFGMLQTIHMTEGETLVAAWGCWFGAIIFSVLGVFLWRNK
mgnify:CR=1 FL=1